MDVAKEDEKLILMDLRKLTNEVINSLPEISYNCCIENCG